MEQQTAVEWLYNHLFPKQLDGFSDEEWNKIDNAFQQAKQMEKEDREKQFNKGWNIGYDRCKLDTKNIQTDNC